MNLTQNLITFFGITLLYIIAGTCIDPAVGTFVFVIISAGFALGVECAMNERSRNWFSRLPDSLMEI